MEQQRRIERQDQSFVRRNVGAFFHRLRLHRKFLHRFQRIDQVNAFAERFTGDSAEQRQHADVAGGNRSDAPQQKKYDDDTATMRRNPPPRKLGMPGSGPEYPVRESGIFPPTRTTVRIAAFDQISDQTCHGRWRVRRCVYLEAGAAKRATSSSEGRTNPPIPFWNGILSRAGMCHWPRSVLGTKGAYPRYFPKSEYVS